MRFAGNMPSRQGTRRRWTPTFFKCGLDLFESRLMHAYRRVDDRLVDDRRRVFIEHIYFDQLRETDAGDFSLSPELVGQQASTGKVYAPYDEEVIRAPQRCRVGPGGLPHDGRPDIERRKAG